MAAAISDVCVLGNDKCGIWYIRADDDKVGQDHFGGAAFFVGSAMTGVLYLCL